MVHRNDAVRTMLTLLYDIFTSLHFRFNYVTYHITRFSSILNFLHRMILFIFSKFYPLGDMRGKAVKGNWRALQLQLTGSNENKCEEVVGTIDQSIIFFHQMIISIRFLFDLLLLHILYYLIFSCSWIGSKEYSEQDQESIYKTWWWLITWY